MKRALFLILSFFTAITAVAQTQYTLSGRIVDATGQTIPFASVYIRNSTYGTSANEYGRYQLKLAPGEYNVMYRFVGFKELNVRITITDKDVVQNIQMQNEVYALKEVKIVARGKRFEDEGMAIMREVIKKRKHYLEQVNAYSCAVYIKGVQKLLKAPKALMSKEVAQALDLDSNGRGILYQSESLSQFNYQRPDKVREITIASKVAGSNPAFSYNKASDLQLNLYENIFTINGLSSRGFVTPVADDAFTYYRFRYMGSNVINGETIDKIQLVPRYKYSQAFQGNIYIVHGDWRIYSADLLLTSATNAINLVDTLQISQQFVPVKDDIWMPVSVHFDYGGTVLGFKFSGYYIGVYNNYKIEPQFAPDFFNGEILRVDTAANKKDADYWAATRPIPLTSLEQRDYLKKDSVFEWKHTDTYLDSAQRRTNKFNPLAFTIFGYDAADWRTKRSWHLEPLYKTVYYNTVEGWGINLSLTYKRQFDKLRAITLMPTVRYGFAGKMLSANMRTDYMYDQFHAGHIYVSGGTDIPDLNNVGTRSLFFNTVSSLIYENNYVKYYRSKFGEVGYQRELANGILWSASLGYSNRRQLYNVSFNHIFDSKNKEYTSNNPLAPPGAPADDRSFLFPDHNALTFKTTLGITFKQRYLNRPDGKVYLESKYPHLELNYRKGVNALGSNVNYDFVSVDVFQNDIQIGLYGRSSFKITAGAFPNRNRIYFMDYNHFLGNVGLTFDPTYIGSFHFLPFYEFSTDRAFLEAHYFHNFSGVLFNKIGFLRSLKLEEIIGGNYLNAENRRNYYEAYVGIKRLFFRVDYGVSFAGNGMYKQGIRLYYGIR